MALDHSGTVFFFLFFFFFFDAGYGCFLFPLRSFKSSNGITATAPATLRETKKKKKRRTTESKFPAESINDGVRVMPHA